MTIVSSDPYGTLCGNNPANWSDPNGEAAVFHYSPSGGYYTYWVNSGWEHYMNQWVPGTGGQCAAGAQILSGGPIGGVYHDVPRARETWIQGATLSNATTDGTVVSTGWQKRGYPSLNPDAYHAIYGADATVNHTGILIGFDIKGNAYILNQAQSHGLGFTILTPEEQKQWNEVTVAEGNGPYDPAPSGMHGGNGGAGGGTFPGGFVLFAQSSIGALFTDGSGWRPIGDAPADVRWAPNSGTGNYAGEKTFQQSLMGSGWLGTYGEGFHPHKPF